MPQTNGGYTPCLTVLNAESQLFPAELNYAQTRTSLLHGLCQHLKAMGGGWVNQAEMLTEVSEPYPLGSATRGGLEIRRVFLNCLRFNGKGERRTAFLLVDKEHEF